MTNQPDIAALIGSRICHDLISPIGAIGNGVELLMLEGSVKGPEISLISESVANASARIRYFRVAFGAASAQQRIGRAEVTSILSDIFRGGRLSVDWQSPADLARAEVKLAFLLMHCLESALPLGGRITVDHTDGHWQMSAFASKTRPDPALWDILSGAATPADISAGHVHFALVPQELSRVNRALTVEMTETSIRLRF